MGNNWPFWSRVHSSFASDADLLLIKPAPNKPECVLRFGGTAQPFDIEMTMIDGWPAARLADDDVPAEVRIDALCTRDQLVEAAAQMLREDRDRQAVAA